mgnify:CR=1 FL=1
MPWKMCKKFDLRGIKERLGSSDWEDDKDRNNYCKDYLGFRDPDW